MIERTKLPCVMWWLTSHWSSRTSAWWSGRVLDNRSCQMRFGIRLYIPLPVRPVTLDSWWSPASGPLTPRAGFFQRGILRWGCVELFPNLQCPCGKSHGMIAVLFSKKRYSDLTLFPKAKMLVKERHHYIVLYNTPFHANPKGVVIYSNFFVNSLVMYEAHLVVFPRPLRKRRYH